MESARLAPQQHCQTPEGCRGQARTLVLGPLENISFVDSFSAEGIRLNIQLPLSSKLPKILDSYNPEPRITSKALTTGRIRAPEPTAYCTTSSKNSGVHPNGLGL